MRKFRLHPICCCLLLLIATVQCLKENETEKTLNEVYSWKFLEFQFESDHDREFAISNGTFRLEAALPIDVDVYYGTGGRKVFITMPRWERGIPVTLGYVTDVVSESGNPLIAPYPNWEWNKLDQGCDSDSIISVYRIEVDECDRIWVLDAGILGVNRICPPQILSFDLKTNELLSRYRFPRGQYKDYSNFVTPVVDVRSLENHCSDTFVYMADNSGPSLVVYDHQNSRSWKIQNNLFYPYPPYGTFQIKNDVFDQMDGILGLALSPLRPNEDRILYFHSFSSRTESYVPTSVIRNFTLFEKNPFAASRSFQSFPVERLSQSAPEAMDHNGVLFFGLVSNMAIGCWNSKDFPEFGGQNLEILVSNDETLQFTSGLKLYMNFKLNQNETCFRIQSAYVDDLVRGTKCSVQA